MSQSAEKTAQDGPKTPKGPPKAPKMTPKGSKNGPQGSKNDPARVPKRCPQGFESSIRLVLWRAGGIRLGVSAIPACRERRAKLSCQILFLPVFEILEFLSPLNPPNTHQPPTSPAQNHHLKCLLATKTASESLSGRLP